MRIITLESVAGIGEGDYIYEGSGYLFRFSIKSPEEFFAVQLPFLVARLGIDIRQIMRLELGGGGNERLHHVQLLVSLEDSSQTQITDDLLGELRAAPEASEVYAEESLTCDALRERLIDFLLEAPSVPRAKFATDFDAILRAKRSQRAKPYQDVAGVLLRVSIHGSPPRISEWRNILLSCREILRSRFRPERLVNVKFTAVPCTEESYCIEADLLLPSVPAIHDIRCELVFAPRLRQTSRPKVATRPFAIERPENVLDKQGMHLLRMFDDLNSDDRLALWSKHLSKYFRPAAKG